MPPAIAVVAFLLASSGAYAQEEVGDEQARIHFESGRSHYSNGNYRQAISEWQTAYELSHHAEILFNLYQANQRLGDLPEAADHLARFLAEEEEIDDRESLENRLSNLRAEIAVQERRADAEAQSDRERERAREEAEASAEAHERGAQTRRTAALVSFIVGGVGLATFGVFAGLSAAEDSRLSSSCGVDAGQVCSDEELSTLEAYTLTADIALGVGIAGAVVGGILWLTTLGSGDDAGEEASVRFAPVVGPDVVGAHGQVRF